MTLPESCIFGIIAAGSKGERHGFETRPIPRDWLRDKGEFDVLWMTIFIMSVAAVGFLAWPLLHNVRSGNGQRASLWVLALMAPFVILGLASMNWQDRSLTMEAETGTESIAWPGSSTMTQPLTEESVSSVAPVGSLVAGLRARLEQNPEDVKGWALLAQSYAFMADGAGAEEAVARAVALGFDEADLRNRVELAFQSSRTPTANTGQTSVPGIIHGVVKLAPDADMKLSPDHRLFVFAKAMDGSTVPVAVIRRRVDTFPFTFALSNRESMAPGVSLTDFEQVSVSARLSASGTAEPGDADVQSNAQVVRVASPDWVELIIGG